MNSTPVNGRAKWILGVTGTLTSGLVLSAIIWSLSTANSIKIDTDRNSYNITQFRSEMDQSRLITTAMQATLSALQSNITGIDERATSLRKDFEYERSSVGDAIKELRAKEDDALTILHRLEGRLGDSKK